VNVAPVLTLILLAFFLAAQPWSVLAAILLVTARGGVRKEIAFAAGWVLALTAVAVATVVLYPEVPKASTSSQGFAWADIAVAIVLGLWLLWRWRRPTDPGAAKQPAWMARIDNMSAILAFALGAFLPTYIVVAAAISQLLSSGLSDGWLVVVAAAWVILASAGVAAPLAVLIIRRDDAPLTYQRWRSWIELHSRAVLFSVGGIVCIVLAVKGLIGILS
jgi:threonine/homoserine/homoserine lactone efflux protein